MKSCGETASALSQIETPSHPSLLEVQVLEQVTALSFA